MFEFLAEEINMISEADASMSVDWNYDDLGILKPADQTQQGSGSGSSGGGSTIIPVGKQKPSKNNPPNNQKGGNPEQGEPSDGNGEKGQEGSDGNPNETGEQSSGGQGNSDKSDKDSWGNMPTSFDDHTKFGKNAGAPPSTQQWISNKGKEFAKRSGTKDPSKWGSEAGYLYRQAILEVQRQNLPLAKIYKMLDKFKMEISESLQNDESYALSALGASSQGGSVNSHFRPYSTQSMKEAKKNALLFFAVDTSGSMGDEQYKLVYGWLDAIAEHFEKEQFGVKGRVYVLEFDTKVATPIQAWKSGLRVRFRGGGGTDVDEVFRFLNQFFVKKNEGKFNNTYKLNFSDSMKLPDGSPLIQTQEGQKPYDAGDNHIIKTESAAKQAEGVNIGPPPKGYKFNYGDVVYEPKYSNVGNAPFLMIFTDGGFETPTNFGPLYENNMGNILYIAWREIAIQNCRPKNFIYCDMGLEGFEDTVASDYDISNYDKETKQKKK